MLKEIFPFVMVDEEGENHVVENEFFFCSLWKQNASLYTSPDAVGLTNRHFLIVFLSL